MTTAVSTTLWAIGTLALLTAAAPAAAAGNSGKSAIDCVTVTRDKTDVVFENNCGGKIFVVWCGDLKYSKKRCGDGPAGNSFYTHSNNVAAGATIRASGVVGGYRYAACEGGIAFDKAPIQDQPDGSFTCVASKNQR